MKKILLLCVLIAGGAYAEEDCPSAADAAEAQNPNAYKDCDYSNSGLNGVLHRALKKKTDKDGDAAAAVAESPSNAQKSTDAGKAAEPAVKEESAKNTLAKGEFNSVQQLQTLRFSLIQKAAVDCPKGFLLESEKYLPQADKAMKLELLYHCL